MRSLLLETRSVPPNAAIVFTGHFDAVKHLFTARGKEADIDVQPTEIWGPLAPINPGGEQWYLIRPQRGEWPAGESVTIDVLRLPVDGSEAPLLAPSFDGPPEPIVPPTSTHVERDRCTRVQSFRVAIGRVRATTPPVVGAIGRAREETQTIPIYGTVTYLYMDYEAMRSQHSPVLYLELGFDQDRSEYWTYVAGVVRANEAGTLAMRPMQAIPRLAGGRLVDTAGLCTTVPYQK